MIKNKSKNLILPFLFGFLLFVYTSETHAQSALSLSVSPTLFDMSANPTQEVKTMIRIINPNPYEISVYADVVNFAPQGESGQGKFVPILSEETDGQTVAEWVRISKDEIVIPAERTVEIPFSIIVPDQAPPGGHFAALLIGTKPPDTGEAVQVVTSQIVTSLLFLKVTGEVVEAGDIRSFRTTEKILEKTEATFELRFENTGNVHILPQGSITIRNMWGQERGIIPINRSTLFGNVLPDSIRKYNFTWTGEWSLADMGRYTALASLAYGEKGRKFSSSEISFWVIPWKMALGVLAGLALFIYLFSLAVKLYIRKMLMVAGVSNMQQSQYPITANKTKQRISVVAPIEAGMLDLRNQWNESTSFYEKLSGVLGKLSSYRLLFAFIVLIAVLVAFVIWYTTSVSVPERSFDITLDTSGEEVRISSEQIKYQESQENISNEIQESNENLPKLLIVNRSGVSGLAARLATKLEETGYEVIEVTNDLGVVDKNTVIVYAPESVDQAVVLSQKITDSLLSSFAGAVEDRAPITIYVGKNLENTVQ